MPAPTGKGHDASTDPAERDALARDLMTALLMRGTALERIGEYMIELVPDRADEFRQQIEHARAEQRVARQRLVEAHAALAARSGRSCPAGRSVLKV